MLNFSGSGKRRPRIRRYFWIICFSVPGVSSLSVTSSGSTNLRLRPPPPANLDAATAKPLTGIRTIRCVRVARRQPMGRRPGPFEFSTLPSGPTAHPTGRPGPDGCCGACLLTARLVSFQVSTPSAHGPIISSHTKTALVLRVSTRWLTGRQSPLARQLSVARRPGQSPRLTGRQYPGPLGWVKSIPSPSGILGLRPNLDPTIA